MDLSLAYIKSLRLIDGCIGLNACIVILSLLALCAVVKRRFELFSFISLSLFVLANAGCGVVQTLQIHELNKNRLQSTNLIGGNLLVLLLISSTCIPLFAILHNLFALQYLRSSLTVPLFFERQLRKDSNFTEMLVSIDQQITNRKWMIISIQTVLLLSGLAFVTFSTYIWAQSSDG